MSKLDHENDIVDKESASYKRLQYKNCIIHAIMPLWGEKEFISF